MINVFKESYKLFSVLLLSLLCLNSQAETLHKFKLSEFYSGNSTLRLNGERVSQDLTIPLSPLVNVTRAKIHLQATSSIALLERRSVLSIRFNNTTIGQIAFNPQKPDFSADIEIPTSLWRNEYNTLTFVASQHSTICQDTNAPELWSEINLFKSSLFLETDTVVKNLNLQKLSSFFHPGIGSQRKVKIFTFDDDEHLPLINQSVLPKIAQGVALREQYRGINFVQQSLTQLDEQSKITEYNQLPETYKYSSWYLNENSADDLHVLVGTRDTLVNSLPQSTLKNIKGPFIMIDKTPQIKVEDKIVVASQYRLIVSGITGEDIVNAATSLAFMDDQLNPDKITNVIVQTNSLSRATQRNVTLHPDQTYSLSQIGVDSSVFTGSGLFSKKIQLKLPADFYVAENEELDLSLDFSYGAGFGEGSTLNILMNNEVIYGLALDNNNGNFYHNYKVSVPARFLKGGFNTLEFLVSQKTAPIEGECNNIIGDYLYFQLSNVSTISLPEAVHLARQPNLKLMAQTGYPFAKFTANEDVSIYITQPEMMSAALTMAGKLAQSAGDLITNLSVDLGVPEQLTENALILAKPTDLSDALFDNVATSVTNVKKWPYRLQNYLYNRINADDYDPELIDNAATEMTFQESSLGELAILIASKNPYAKENGTLFFVVAESNEVLTDRVEQLVESTLWSQLSGDFFAWQDEKKPLLVMQISSPYEVGKADSWLEIRAWLSNNPWYWLIAALITALLFSLLAYLLLKRRHKEIKEEW